MGLHKLWTAVESQVGSGVSWHIREAFASTTERGEEVDQRAQAPRGNERQPEKEV
jgi:hypothetical protein